LEPDRFWSGRDRPGGSADSPIIRGKEIPMKLYYSPAKNLAPARDSAERYKLLEWLNFVGTELHKNFGPMFSPVLADDAKAFFKDRVMGKFKYLDGVLAGRDYLMGKQFTVADGYLFTMLAWADRMKFDLSAMPNLLAYKARVGARPMVQQALTKEGLMKAA
jgi:glutathione S-transferase